MSEVVSFLASIPPIDGALKAHGDGGYRLILDLPDDEAPAYIRLLLCRGKVLKVSISPEGARDPARKRTAKRGKRQDERAAPAWGEDESDDTG